MINCYVINPVVEVTDINDLEKVFDFIFSLGSSYDCDILEGHEVQLIGKFSNDLLQTMYDEINRR